MSTSDIPEQLQTPYLRHLGAQVIRFDADGCEIGLEVAAHHCNLQSFGHGGMLASLLDAVSGYAGLFGSEGIRPASVTLSLNIQYHAPAQQGETLLARGRVSGGGQRVFFTQADIIDSQGDTIAVASGVFRRPSSAGAGDHDKGRP